MKGVAEEEMIQSSIRTAFGGEWEYKYTNSVELKIKQVQSNSE